MKKAVLTLLCFALAFSMAACGSPPNPGSGEGSKPVTEYVLTGSISAIADGAMTVEVRDCTPFDYPIKEMKSSTLNVPLIHMPSSPEPVAGDTVEITFCGRITTTLPEGGTEIYSISSADIYGITVIR